MLLEIALVSILYGYISFIVANVTVAFQCIGIKYSLANGAIFDS